MAIGSTVGMTDSGANNEELCNEYNLMHRNDVDADATARSAWSLLVDADDITSIAVAACVGWYD
jgi:hypothetical protein